MTGHLRIMGVLVFLIGLLLTATYSRPDCSGIACMSPGFPVLELSEYRVENGGSVDAYVLAFEGNCSGKVHSVFSNKGNVRFQRKGPVYVADRMEHFEAFYVPGCRGNLTVYTVKTYLSNVTLPNVTYDMGGYLFLSDYSLPLREFYMRVSGRVNPRVTTRLELSLAENFGTYEATYLNGTLHLGNVLYQRPLEGILVKNGTLVREMVVYDNPASYLRFKNCVEHYNETLEACRASGSPEYQLPLGLGLMLAGIALFAYGMKF